MLRSPCVLEVILCWLCFPGGGTCQLFATLPEREDATGGPIVWGVWCLWQFLGWWEARVQSMAVNLMFSDLWSWGPLLAEELGEGEE